MRNDGEVVIGTKMETKTFDSQIKQVENELKSLEKEYEMIKNEKPFKNQKRDLEEIQLESEKLRNKLVDLYKKQDQLNQTHVYEKSNLSIGKIIKKIAKWSVALLGIRGLYGMINSAVGIVTSNNEQLNTDIQYIKTALAVTLEPLIRKIVDLVFTLLQYVSAIIKAWTGKNIFENANKYLEKSNKSAKKLQKTLASFDEMNIVSDNSDNDNGYIAPSVDLSKISEVKMPKWLQAIIDNKEIWLTIGGIVTGLITLSKVGGLFSGLSNFSSLLNPTTAIVGGVAAIGASLYTVERDLDKKIPDDMKKIRNIGNKATSDFIKNTDNVGDIIQQNNIWISAGNDLIEESTTNTLKFQNRMGKLTPIQEEQFKTFQQIAKKQKEILDTEIKLWQNGELTNEEKKKTLDAILKQRQYIIDVKWALDDAGQSTKEIDDLLKNYDETLKNAGFDIETIGSGWRKQTIIIDEETNKIIKSTESSVKDTIDKVGNIFKKVNNEKLEDKKLTIDVDSNTSKADSGLTSWIKKFAQNIQSAFNNIKFTNLANNIGTTITNAFGNVFGTSISSKLKKAFGLAKGGIVNMPGRGVPIDGVRTGEQRPEGVIPLTDSQQMSLLGEAIGKYITINANIVNTMNGRVISKELQRVQNDSDFAFNR